MYRNQRDHKAYHDAQSRLSNVGHHVLSDGLLERTIKVILSTAHCNVELLKLSL